MPRPKTLHETVLVPLSRVQLFVIPWTLALQAPLSLEFSRQEYWSGWPCPPPRDLSDPGIKPTSVVCPVLAGRFFPSATWEAHFRVYWCQNWGFHGDSDMEWDEAWMMQIPKKIKDLLSYSAAQSGKNLPAMQEMWAPLLGKEGPLEKEVATHSSVLAWKIPSTEEPGGL